MLDIKNRIEAAKSTLRRAENAKTVAETQKATAEAQLEDVKVKMAEAGVTPETINDQIAQLEAKLNDDLSKVERLIPTDF
jgi:chromosome segregation ATPase